MENNTEALNEERAALKEDAARIEAQAKIDIDDIRTRLAEAVKNLEARAYEQRERALKESKELKADLEALLAKVKGYDHPTSEFFQVQARLRETIFWVGQDLKELGAIPFSKEVREATPAAEQADPANMI